MEMAKNCNRCGRQIVTAWRTAKGNFYHPHCFTCAICDSVIEPEHQLDNYDLKEIYCKKCYAEYFNANGEHTNPTTPTSMIPPGFLMEGDTNGSLLMKQMPSMFPSETSVDTSPSSSNEIQGQTPSSTRGPSEMEVVHDKKGLNCSKRNAEMEEEIKERMRKNMEISTVLESTKPPGFMSPNAAELIRNQKINWRPECMMEIELSNRSHTQPQPSQISKSKIPKREGRRTGTAKVYSSQSEPSSSEELENNSNNANQVLEKCLPKLSQNLIRTQSFSIPQRIKTKMNDYINSKGLKFGMTHMTPAVVHSQQRGKPNFVIPPSDFKKMSTPLKLGTKTVKGSTDSCTISKSRSAMSACATDGRATPSTPVKSEKKLSKFKMPSFVVPSKFKPINPNYNPDAFFNSIPFKPQLHGSTSSQKLSHYILPHEIMASKVQQHQRNAAIDKIDGGGRDFDYNDNDTDTCEKIPSYFGNITLPRPIPKTSREESTTSGRKVKKSCAISPCDVGSRNLDCPICLEKLVNLNDSEGEGTEGGESKQNVVTCCGHIFHKECIHRWLSTNGNGRCPTCSKLCLKESMIPVYIEANIADNLNIKNADNDELKALLHTLRADYKQLKEKYQSLALEHSQCATRFAITDSLRSAYEMECRTRGQLQWENKHLHQKLQEFRAMVAIEQGDSFENSLSDNK